MASEDVKLDDIFPLSSALSDEDRLARAAEISPHLARLFRLFSDDLPLIKSHQGEVIMDQAKADLIEGLNNARTDDEYMAAIRHYRGRVNHLVATSDFLDLVDVNQHMAWLSDAAETALSQLAQILTGDDAINQGWFILALGKLGARELNYSSDIDLIVITLNDYDDYDAAKRYIRLTRQITSLMSQPTKDGLGWRVDLRLRPDPGATPVAIGRDAALSYYESIARTWERAAFIRARPVAGNIKAGQAFLDDLKPFIWRRYLDYTVLEDLKIMLRREARPQDLLGYNVKNGLGGIRSIEFFVHAQQLIAGGREVNLRITSTPKALGQLTVNDWINQSQAQSLISAYGIWRKVEHRLQMIGDAQTHQMPKSEEAMEAFARFCGHNDMASFKRQLIALGDQVIKATEGLLHKLIQDSTTPADDALPFLSEDNDATQERLSNIGFASPHSIITTCEGWLAGRISATRSPRSRDLLAKLLPRLLAKFAELEHPDAGFNAFARLVEGLPAGLQLFSLIDSHDDIAQMIVAIASSAPTLADQISLHPMLADALLYQSFWTPEEHWDEREEELHQKLTDLPFYEDQLSLLRQQCREWQFRTSAQLLQGHIDGENAGVDYTLISDAIIRSALPVVEREVKRRFGAIENGGIAIYALGRCGAREMTLTSDLDLIFIFDAPDGSASDGKRSLMGNAYFARFGQELINALSSPTAEGRCYEVDMRLRPSGNKGPLSIHIDGFEEYQLNDAWTWEHMALIKCRYVGGINSEGIRARMDELTPKIIKMKRDDADLKDKVAEMREKLQNAFPAKSDHDVRAREGGIMDIDFITQMLQMSNAAQALPIKAKALDAIAVLSEAGLLQEDDAKALTNAAKFYLEIIQWMRLTGIRISHSDDPEIPLPPSVKARFGIASFGALDQKVNSTAEPILSIVKKYVCKA